MSIWKDKTHEQWGDMGKRAEIFVEKVSGRDDLAVVFEPDLRNEDLKAKEPIPAGVFYPSFARINVNSSLIFDEEDIDNVELIDPNGFFFQQKHPKLIGTLVHESAHAKHSKWRMPTDKPVDDRIIYWVKLLEETRAERKILEEHPQYVGYIKTILKEIVFLDIGSQQQGNIYDRYSAAHAALLVCARESIGVVEADEISDVISKVVSILGIQDFGKLAQIWLEGQNVDDDEDIDALYALGERIQKLIDVDNEGKDFIFSARTPCGAFTEDDDSDNHDNSGIGNSSDGVDNLSIPSPSLGGQLDASIKDFIEKVNIKEVVAIDEDEHPAIRRRREEAARKREIGNASKAINKISASSGGYSHWSYRKPVKSLVPTKPKDVARMRAVMKALQQAQYREIHKSLHSSATPPGRLQLREAMNRDAQVSSRQSITAEPWKQTRRRDVENPPLTLGIATDISGSMDKWQREVASYTWAVSNAVKNLQGKVGAVAWDTNTYDWLDPNRFSKELTTYTCYGGSSGCAGAIKASDGLMNLSFGEGVRVLVVITDGELGNTNAAIQKEINLLASRGVIVLWLLTSTRGFKPKNAVVSVLKTPEDFGKVVSKTIVEALEKA